MGLFTGLLLLPLAPARGVVRLSEFIYDRAAEQYYNPGLIRREMELISDALMAGEISEEEAAEREEELVARLMEARERGF